MYKTRTSRSKRYRKLLLPLALGALILAAGFFIIRNHNNTPASSSTSSNTLPTVAPKKIDNSPARPSDNTANETRKSSSSDSPTLNNSGATSGNLSVTISNARVITDSSGDKFVHVGNLVNGASSGTCTLTATKTGQPKVTDTGTVQLDGNTYDCGVFNTPTSKFPSSGTWNLTLTVTSGSSSGSATSTVTI